MGDSRLCACYNKRMKLSRLLFIIAVIIVGVWALGLVFKLVAWVLSSLLYIAAIIVIVGLVRYWWESRKSKKTDSTES